MQEVKLESSGFDLCRDTKVALKKVLVLSNQSSEHLIVKSIMLVTSLFSNIGEKCTGYLKEFIIKQSSTTSKEPKKTRDGKNFETYQTHTSIQCTCP